MVEKRQAVRHVEGAYMMLSSRHASLRSAAQALMDFIDNPDDALAKARETHPSISYHELQIALQDALRKALGGESNG